MCGFFFHTGFQIKNPESAMLISTSGEKFTADDRT